MNLRATPTIREAFPMAAPTLSRPHGLPLSELPLLRALVRWRWFPYFFQALMLVIVVALAWLGLRSAVPADVDDKLVAKGTLVTLLVWGLWWPSMIWGAAILGRVWCTVCPLELVANIGERVGRRLGIGGRTLGRIARGGWIVLALYVVMQLMVPGIHLHRSALLTAGMILAMIVLAAVTGLLYRDRAFCRGVCPVSMLLGSYGRAGAVTMRAASAEPCARCTTHDCTSAWLRAAPDARSCPSLLDPARLASGEDCLVCGQCIKVCPEQNMQMVLRAPYARADRRATHPRWAVVLFVVTASGFVTSEIAGEWAAAKAVFVWAPKSFTALMGAEAYAGWIEGIWTLALMPALLWLLLALIASRGSLRGIPAAARSLALPMVVVVAAAHMAKAFIKGTSWAGFLPGALDDPTNGMFSAGVAAGTIAKPPALASPETASIVGLLLLAAGLVLALRELRLVGALRASMAVAVVILAALYGVIVAGW